MALDRSSMEPLKSRLKSALSPPSLGNALGAISHLATFGIVFARTEYYTLGNGSHNVGNVASTDGLASLQTLSFDEN